MPSINRKQHFHLSGKQAGLAVTSVHPFWIFPIDEDFQCSAAQRQLHTGDKIKGEKNKKKQKSVQSNQSLWKKIFPGDFIVLKYCLPLFYLYFNVAHSQKMCKTSVLLRFGGIIGHKFTSWPEMCLNVCLSAAYLFFRMYVEGEHRYKWV